MGCAEALGAAGARGAAAEAAHVGVQCDNAVRARVQGACSRAQACSLVSAREHQRVVQLQRARREHLARIP